MSYAEEDACVLLLPSFNAYFTMYPAIHTYILCTQPHIHTVYVPSHTYIHVPSHTYIHPMYLATHTYILCTKPYIHTFYVPSYLRYIVHVLGHCYLRISARRRAWGADLIFFWFPQGGGLGALNWGTQDLVQEPIPVRVEDGWLN